MSNNNVLLAVKAIQVGCSNGYPYLSIALERTLESEEIRETFMRLHDTFNGMIECEFIGENIDISPKTGYFQTEDYSVILNTLGLGEWHEKILVHTE